MPAEHVDVLIVGAGLSGIGAACHLVRELPGRTYTILEARGAMGGTWDLFRYPGVRSDSDMYTLGYAFRPWTGATAIADGDSIREYIRDTAREYGVDRHIRYHHRVLAAEWSTATARWTVTARRTGPGTDPALGSGTDPAVDSGTDPAGPGVTAGEAVTITCGFLFVCSGYYRYDQGYSPEFPGAGRYQGRIVHPQHWPDNLDHAGRRIVVIGSGATAVTLVPALARTAAHVTMVQRSPGYVLSLPAVDPLAGALRRRLPPGPAYTAVRWKNVLAATVSYQLARRAPGLMKSLLRKGVTARLPAGYDVATHFTPRYDPWDQRLCFAPDGDFFTAISDGRASVVTDRVAEFTATGLRLASGTAIDADIVVTATGLSLLTVGGMALSVDGRPVDLADTVAYKGMMLSGVPNFAMTLGYTNASWTLKSDLVAGYVCRLLRHLDRRGMAAVVPVAPPAGPREPLIGLKSGYVLRSAAALPRQGPATPWRLHQNYPRDLIMLRYGRVADRGVRFIPPGARAAGSVTAGSVAAGSVAAGEA